MAQDNDNHTESQLPQVLVLRQPGCWTMLESNYSHKFNFLKAWDSPLPQDQFLAGHAGSVQALLSSSIGPPITANILGMLPSLKVIVTTSAGLDHVDLPKCRERGVVVASAPEVHTHDVADLAVGLFLDVMRKISAGDRYVRDRLWASRGEFSLVSKIGGKRIGIVGLGNIGLEVAKRLEAFGCSILYNSRKEKPFVPYPFYSNICELALNSDALIICCALTAETHHLINNKVLLALGRDGIIVNVGRGAIIDEKEMVQCLVKGEIGGAGLDVFETEPQVPKELFPLDNVVLSPHNGPCTPEYFMDLCELVAGNLAAFFSNRPLLSPALHN
ncbi:glyoxylate/hydroxypyruvate reductase HPR3-like [Pyrus x bretschneideri]|uniref:glyoxylate/hydroxypyruvate reductase HPR3-like n=1 Tax=Pyrus x bretschneideri TaxID=225117 RepID=UPI002030CE8F|nr:glyoxylate/hydroxypyruvate reductase HPR3-like [Pyrus x bretschneideri]